ncbi:MAG: aminopeptidase N C-terminal domain-containing protein, partial [Planctomycetota bacterium]
EDEASLDLAAQQLDAADNMTEWLAPLVCLVAHDPDRRPQVLRDFYERWKDVPLVVDKWLSVQALAEHDNALEEVKRLLDHPAFDQKNPNKVRSLVRTFAANQLKFHAADGSGYTFLAEQIQQLDGLNPQIAARIAGAFSQWRRFDSERQKLMKAALESIAALPDLSKDTSEIVSRCLQAAG